MGRMVDGNVPVKKFGQRTTNPGFRLNLTALEEDIAYLQRDRDYMLKHGHYREALEIRKEIVRLQDVHRRGVDMGTGYYEYRVKGSLGKTLMIAVITLLTVLLFIGYLAVVLN